MRTTDAIKMLDQFNQILKHVPEMPLPDALNYIFKAVKQYVPKQEKEKLPEPNFEVEPEFLERLDKVDTTKLKSFIQNSDVFSHKAKLQALVRLIGIPFTKKQTKDVLLNLVVHHYKLQRMDSMVRTHQTHEEPIEIESVSE